MTKVAILYGSRYGTTTGIVQEMVKTAEETGAEVETFEVRKSKPASLDSYDLIIIGSGIQVGKWTKEPLKFIEQNVESLSRKKVALFVVCGDAGNPETCEQGQTMYLDAIAKAHPEISFVSTGLFPGMFDLKKYNFVTKSLIKSILKKRTPEGEEIPEVLDMRDSEKVKAWILELVQF